MAQGEGTRQSTLKLPKLKTWNWDSRKGKAAGVCKAEYGRRESCIKILHGSAEVCSLVPINTCLVGNHQTYRKKHLKVTEIILTVHIGPQIVPAPIRVEILKFMGHQNS